METEKSILFVVSETRTRSPGHFRIEWRLPAILGDYANGEHLTRFLYWAYDQGTMYVLRPPCSRGAGRSRTLSVSNPSMTADLELSVLGGGAGEYRDGLYWCGRAGVLYRKLTGTHYLTHHGLDGLPFIKWRRLFCERGIPRFQIEPAQGGKFCLSMDEWQAHLASGKNYARLSELGFTVVRDG